MHASKCYEEVSALVESPHISYYVKYTGKNEIRP
jgi:hypothetical protein